MNMKTYAMAVNRGIKTICPEGTLEGFLAMIPPGTMVLLSEVPEGEDPDEVTERLASVIQDTKNRLP